MRSAKAPPKIVPKSKRSVPASCAAAPAAEEPLWTPTATNRPRRIAQIVAESKKDSAAAAASSTPKKQLTEITTNKPVIAPVRKPAAGQVIDTEQKAKDFVESYEDSDLSDEDELQDARSVANLFADPKCEFTAEQKKFIFGTATASAAEIFPLMDKEMAAQWQDERDQVMKELALLGTDGHPSNSPNEKVSDWTEEQIDDELRGICDRYNKKFLREAGFQAGMLPASIKILADPQVSAKSAS